MSTRSNNVKIGIFVLLAVVLFIAGLLAFGARSYFVPKSQFETAIPGEVSGLSVGSGVQLRGVPVEVKAPNPIKGAVLGVEKQTFITEEKTTIKRDVLTILTDEGLRSFVLAEVAAVITAETLPLQMLAAVADQAGRIHQHFQMRIREPWPE